MEVSEWKKLGRFEVQFEEVELQRLHQFGLSRREWQTLRLIAEGKTSAQIASALNVQRSTVDTYKKRIFEKLDVRSATEATSLAIALLSGANLRERKYWEDAA